MSEQNQQFNQQLKERNPYTVWFVILAFVSPVALAYIMFYFVDVSSFSNHGEIYSPVVDITELKLTDKNGELIPDNTGQKNPEDTLRYKWRFYSFVDNQCDVVCKNRLIDTRQLHKAFGKDAHRITRVVVYLDSPDDLIKKFIESELPAAKVMYANYDVIKKALNITTEKNEVFISDPMGNIMMRFREEQPLKELQSDMKKLLKASQIG